MLIFRLRVQFIYSPVKMHEVRKISYDAGHTIGDINRRHSYYSAPVWELRIAMNVSVCLSVCIFVCTHISRTICPNFTKCSGRVTYGRGSVLLW